MSIEWSLVRKYLQSDFVETPNDLQFRILVSSFEQLHGISYIIRAIDGLHIHV